MKVSRLIELLSKMPQDLDVVLATDDEGNGFREVPDGWCTVEKFLDGDIVATEDIDIEYELDYEDKVVIG